MDRPRLNVALVLLHADPARGGAERYTIDLAAGLRGRGHRVVVVASTFAELVRHQDDVQLPTPGLTRAARYRRFLDALDRHLAGQRYGVVHAMLPVRHCDVYHPHAGLAVEALEPSPIKYDRPLARALAQIGGRFNRRRRAFAAVERALLSAGGERPVVLCLSEYVRRAVRRQYDLPESRLPMLFNAVDLRRFDPQARPDAGREVRRRWQLADDRIVALIVAQDFARKGLAEAIRAMALHNDRRVALIVVGKDDPAPYLALARREGVADRVLFAGPTDDPYAYYRAADVFVLPTRHDPCSLVVLEALAMGVPVISTAANGACQAMTDGVHGRVLPEPTDVPRLAEALRDACDPVRRHAMNEACLALRPTLSFDHHLDQLETIYAGVARGRSRDV